MSNSFIRNPSLKTKIAMEILVCFFVIVAHTSAYVVDRSSVVSAASHYDDTVSSGEAPTILDLLTRLDVHLSSLEKGHVNLEVEGPSLEQQGNDLNEVKEATISGRHARDVGCTEPSTEKLRAQLLQAKFFGSSITQNEFSTQLEAFAATFGSAYINNHCELEDVLQTRDLLNKPLNKRSSCPWKYENNTSNDRYPKTIYYAICECTKCIEGNIFSNTNTCKPIIEPRYVLTKGECGANNEYQYAVSEEYVSVGCACQRASTT